MWGKKNNDNQQISQQKRFDAAVQILNSRPSEAFTIIQELAQEGFTPAKNDLGSYYQNGFGCKQDNVLAVKWFREGYNDGDTMAGLNLAQHLAYGIGTKQDITSAMGICTDALKTENEYNQFASSLLFRIVDMQQQHDEKLNQYVSAFKKNFNVGRHKESISIMSEAITEYPRHWILYKYRALSRSQIEDDTGAKTDLDKAIQLKPNEISLYDLRYMVRCNLNDPNAIEDYRPGFEERGIIQ